MSEPFLGELKVISWNFPPKGWAFCNGTLLPINQNQALFSILGTTYDGDGRTTFGLPNLQGRTPIHVGNGISSDGGSQPHENMQPYLVLNVIIALQGIFPSQN